MLYNLTKLNASINLSFGNHSDYEEETCEKHEVIGILLLLIFLVSMIFNLSLLALIYRSREVKETRNLYLIGLLLIIIINGSLDMPLLILRNFTCNWSFGYFRYKYREIPCKLQITVFLQKILCTFTFLALVSFENWGIVNNCYTNRPKRAEYLRRKCWKIVSIILIYIISGLWVVYPIIAEIHIPADDYFYARYVSGLCIISWFPHGVYFLYVAYINPRFCKPLLSLCLIVWCRTTYLWIPLLVSLYDKKLNVVRLFGFCCKSSEEIKEEVEEMEMEEFIAKREFDYHSYNIHY